MLNKLEMIAPKTKPNWTAMVSQAEALEDRFHNSRNCGMTAEAENQVDIDNIKVSASNINARHLPIVSVSLISCVICCFFSHPKTNDERKSVQSDDLSSHN
jgi:hypothetical protein